MTHCAPGLKGPAVGDVVTKVVDLELENKAHQLVELYHVMESCGLINLYLGWSVPVDDDRQSVIQHVSGSHPTILKFQYHLIWKHTKDNLNTIAAGLPDVCSQIPPHTELMSKCEKPNKSLQQLFFSLELQCNK